MVKMRQSQGGFEGKRRDLKSGHFPLIHFLASTKKKIWYYLKIFHLIQEWKIPFFGVKPSHNSCILQPNTF